MRPVLPGDVSAAARALLRVPSVARPALARRMLQEADAADCYRRRFRRAHRDWGNGTLMAAALARPAGPEPRLDDPDYLDCQFVMLEALLTRTQPEAQEMQRRAVGSSSRRLTAISSPQSSQ